MRMFKKICQICLCSALLVTAQGTRDQWFPFYLPWDDTSGNVTNLSHMLDAPAGKYGFLQTTEDGRFRFENGSNRARFTGFVSVGEANFPDTADAPKIAARLARFGVNLLRIHLIDVDGRYGIFQNSRASTLEFDENRLKKMDYFFKCLKEQGIYINLGLHMGRIFKEDDGIPAPITNDQSKFVTLFDSSLIALQKQYAKDLFEHVNPYTGLAYKNDPFVAFTELTNENSLFLNWLSWGGDKLQEGSDDQAHSFYIEVLDSIYQEWLREKYADDAELARAWGTAGSGAENMIDNVSFESGLRGWGHWFDATNGAEGEVSLDTAVSYDGDASARVDVISAGKEVYHISFSHSGFSVEKGKTYRLQLFCKSSKQADFKIEFLKEHVWDWYGDHTVSSDTSWSMISSYFSAPETVVDSLRFNLNLGHNANTTFWIDSVTFHEYDGDGLLEDESLAEGTVRRMPKSSIGRFSTARFADEARFYYDVEGRYIETMTSYLKDTLGLKIPVTFTNNYYGLTSIASQARADFMDAHAYWDHPHFPNGWSDVDYVMKNTPMVKKIRESTINTLALSRVKDKPFVVSEYNHPYPNQYQCEAPALLFGYMGFFDADAIYWHAYIDYTLHYEQVWQKPFFSLGYNPVMMTQMLLAKPFRDGRIQPAAEQTDIHFSQRDVFEAGRTYLDHANLNTAASLSHTYPLQTPIRYGSFDADSTTETASLPDPGDVVTSSTGELHWDGVSGVFRVDNPYWQGAVGYLGSMQDFPAYDIKDVQTTNDHDFAAIHMVSLDSLPLTESEKIVLLTSARMENPGTEWNASLSTVTDFDTDTIICEPVTAQVGISVEGGEPTLYVLDEKGNRDGTVEYLEDEGVLWFNLPGNTLWYELDLAGGRLETSVRKAGDSMRQTYVSRPRLSSDGVLNVDYIFPGKKETHIELTVFNVAGRVLKSHSFIASGPTGRSRLQLPQAAGVRVISVKMKTGDKTIHRRFKLATVR